MAMSLESVFENEKNWWFGARKNLLVWKYLKTKPIWMPHVSVSMHSHIQVQNPAHSLSVCHPQSTTDLNGAQPHFMKMYPDRVQLLPGESQLGVESQFTAWRKSKRIEADFPSFSIIYENNLPTFVWQWRTRQLSSWSRECKAQHTPRIKLKLNW